MISKITFGKFKANISSILKKKLKKFLFFFLAIYIVIYLIKFSFYYLTNGRQDKNLKDILLEINHLKSQNEELLKYNREFMTKFKDEERNLKK
jgi:hypothetical protein